MKKKIEETIVIRSDKMVYAVRLASKLEGEGSRIENRTPYLIAESGKIKFIDNLYGSKCEFNFADEVHQVAKEVFISNLQSAIKEELLQLKQLELVLSEMGLKECLGDVLEQSAIFFKKNEKAICVDEELIDKTEELIDEALAPICVND